jgi:mono/diheme cytochrome c family protein
MIITRLIIIVIVFIGITSCGNQDTPETAGSTVDSTAIIASRYRAGKNLFIQNCSPCHAINHSEDPPLLKDVEDRWSDRNKLYAFIRDPQDVIKADGYAKDLYEKYNKLNMPAFPNLTNKDIDDILLYVRLVYASKR